MRYRVGTVLPTQTASLVVLKQSVILETPSQAAQDCTFMALSTNCPINKHTQHNTTQPHTIQPITSS